MGNGEVPRRVVLLVTAVVVAIGSIGILLLLNVSTEWDGQTPLWPDTLPAEIRFERVELARVEVGGVSDLRLRQQEDGTSVLLVAGSRRLVEVEYSEGRVLRRIEYSRSGSPARFVPGQDPPELRLLRSASAWVGPTALLDLDGATLWENSAPVVEMRDILDLDADGRLEVLVREPDGRHVTLLGDDGEARWTADWKGYLEARAFDVGSDGSTEFVLIDGESICVYDSQGEWISQLWLPDAGFVNAIQIVTPTPALEGVALLFGIEVDRQQVFHAYAHDVHTYLGRYRAEDVVFFLGDVRGVERSTGDLLIRVSERRWQAEPADTERSELHLTVGDAWGRPLWSDVLETEGAEAASSSGAVVVVQQEPLDLLVGYDDRVWSITEL